MSTAGMGSTVHGELKREAQMMWWPVCVAAFLSDCSGETVGSMGTA